MLAAILRQEIDWRPLPAETPAGIRQLLRRCLERKPTNRLHDIADARIAIAEVLSGTDEPGVPTAVQTKPGARRFLGAAGMLVAGAALGVFGVLLLRTSTEEPPRRLLQFDIIAPEGTVVMRGLAISPDGRQIAFVSAARRIRQPIVRRFLAAVVRTEGTP